MPQSGGHRLEGLKRDRGTSKPSQGSQPSKKSVREEGTAVEAWGEGESRYHNPEPLCWLIGPRNEVEVIVNDEQVTALVDSGAQISCLLYTSDAADE